ncbi:hypothetical protein CEUSTIGMA_g6009.t1 [Chlamydomonas eustigma]|uniref:Fungal lipase-type domain-containing protein n=1 Tax=Chlamydomonas eustigma TaxID=1157962 RepID=A0A250X6M1_9CHLO|nr:hypothetical protein CEUSTIGMA_g6009.t1 [Chlamydomonas eustigma]|eukprot:GAX78569.1 hypothetical protein CEUSTIGMA_g6009.t1 [Chlamydomonas eustigma]
MHGVEFLFQGRNEGTPEVPAKLSEDLKASGLDTIATVFQRDIATRIISNSGSTDADWDNFDMDLAKTFALFTSIAYCSNTTTIKAWKCSRCQGVPTFQVTDVVFDLKWDLIGYVGYWPERNAIVVAFRGSDSHSWTNWIENLRTWREDGMWPLPDAPNVKVHAGFYNLWSKSDMASNITAAIQSVLVQHPDASLYVTGHSMGAALAQICAVDSKIKLGVAQVHSFTFGSPRVGNAAFHVFYEGLMAESWRFTHNRDVVPSLPPWFLGFHHVAREVWTIDVEPEIPGSPPEFIALMCDTTGEDPSCHNSACRLGLCTSIADHLTYLQHPMYRTEGECSI